MLIRLAPTSTEPLYAQVEAAIRGAVARGEVDAGERLPTARDLADSLGVNMHTVLKAYANLRDQGVIELRRGRGAVVTARPPGLTEVESAARDLVAAARRHGIPLAELQTILERQTT